MKTTFWLHRIFLILTLALLPCLSRATIPAPPGGPDPDVELNSWPFANTNWLSGAAYSPIAFTNLINVTNGGDGNCLLLDTTNLTPAFLFYKMVETGGFTNLVTTNGSISLWLNPSWSSTNQGGTGPGNWANLISVGYAGTNGPWFAWYLSPDGCTVYLSAQATGGASSNCLVAPVSFVGTNWYNLVITYGPTNSAFYTNGVLVTNGTGVLQADLGIPFFAIGSDTNGYYQAGAMVDDMATFNYQLDPGFIQGTLGMYSIFYGLAGAFSPDIVSAPSTNTVTPNFNAVTGAGFLTGTGASPTYPTSSNIWITNYSATIVSSNVMNLNFAVAGGSNNVPYDVFATPVLVTPITNGVWYWMGQAYRGTNYALPMTNLPPSNIYLILGKPQDTDQDGLTDAYENLVSHTDPNNPDSGGTGMLDGWKVVWGLNPLVNPVTQSNLLSNFIYDPVGRLETVRGIRTETIGFDPEGNIQGDSQ